jgi:XapX domain-containing protein
MATVAALVVGIVFGALVRALGLPIPAPPTIAGVLGVVGVALGFYLVGLR